MPAMTQRQRLFIATPLAGILLAAAWWQPDDSNSRSAPGRSVPAAAQAAAVADVAGTGPGTAATSTPASWREAGDDGLPVNAETVATLELACGPPPSPRRAAPPGTLTARYCAYRQALAALPVDTRTPAAMEQSLQDLMDLRRRHFDHDTALALFGAEEAHTRYTLAAIRIRSDHTLSEAEQEARLSALRRDLPPTAARLEAPPPAATTDWLATQSLADARLQRERSATIRKDWDKRYQTFRRHKEVILAAGLSDADKTAQVEALLQQHYDANEMAAAKAYDKAHSPR